jgi:hypothetical protein
MDANTLYLTRVTKDVGATIKPGPMAFAAPEATMTDDMLAEFATDSGLNAPLLADLVVAMAAHENMAVNMFRVLQNVAVNPMLRSTYAQFEQDSLEAVSVHADLMESLGVPMYYISPAARLTEGLDGHMIMSFMETGSADQLTIDLKTVEAVMLGSTMCVANTNLLRQIAEEADDEVAGAIETAVAQLEGPQMAHLTWANQTRERMVLSLVKHPIAKKMTEWAENTIAKGAGKAP